MAVPGPALDPSQPVKGYIRTAFANQDGLSSAIVNDIVESQDGFLWIAAGSRGLSRFDGRKFETIPSPAARVLAVGPDGDLWTGTEEALQRIPAATLNQFGPLPSTSYHPGPGPASHILCLHFSRSGVLWVGTEGGLYRFERGNFSSVGRTRLAAAMAWYKTSDTAD